MQHYLPIILFSFSSVMGFGQGNFNTTDWRFSNPKQFGFTVLDVDFFDNNNAIAVGSDGGIAKTTDGGSNWTYGVYTFVNPVNGLRTKGNFNDVHFITSSIAYAVGNTGLMIKSTDGGVNWSQVITPLTPSSKNINACWFLDANKGYIGGEYNNTADSLPKLYVTLNGGSTWDSIAAPAVNGVTRVGYINNPNIPSVLWPVDAKLKQIYRIEILPSGVGYICGQASPLFPQVSRRAISTSNCLPATTFLTTGAHTAALLWKLENGVLTDYSISKERIGYTGINTNTINCTTGFSNLSPAAQTYKAMNVIDDNTVVIMSFNNNTVVKVQTMATDMTPNVNNGGTLEKGKYEVLNFPFPPTQGPNAGPPIPNPQVLLASNPSQIRRTSNGTLVANGNFGRMWVSVDSGRNWVQSRSLPPGQNFSSNGVWALDIAPNGKFLSMGSLGVVADSLPGGSGWNSNYVTVPLSAAFTKFEFADCNNGVATGSGNINVTND
ncbi:MAG: YCF48-related protein, partial [Bacteroidota bacterium]